MKTKFTIFTLNYGILLLLIGVVSAVGFVLVPSLFSLSNITAMLQQLVVLGLLAYGLSFVLTSGGLDLSLCGIAGLTSVVLPLCLSSGLPLVVALPVALGVALCCGLVNGLIVTLFSAPSFLITISTLVFFRGFANQLSHGQTLSVENVWLQVFGRGSISIVPYAFFILIGVILFTLIVLQLTAFGRYAIGIGSNEDAARLSGVKIGTVKVTCFMLSSLYAGVAGCILYSYAAKSQGDYSLGYELDALVAVLFGGLSYKGGQTRVFSIIVGVLFVVLLTSLLNKLYVGAAIKQIVQGAVLILAIAYNTFSCRVQDNLLRASGS